jgi:hypothetical protein
MELLHIFVFSLMDVFVPISTLFPILQLPDIFTPGEQYGDKTREYHPNPTDRTFFVG